MLPVVVVERVSKRYCITHAMKTGGRGGTLHEELGRLVTAPRRWWRGERDGASEEYWALRDVSFEVAPGDVVGIIGRNGAGKSTLLKVLSRITRPTAGRTRVRGRLGSLLEVGAGFNPELTGRENVYLNGAILGMRRREIDRKFDAIVDFAEIEHFLDTPVKRYSSGMYMRLAFAVAAHLEPEVLIVDEVLGVGDAAFQKKCTAKIEALVKKEHRTVLLVSHNAATASSLCTKGLFLHHGRILYYGDIHQALKLYLSSENLWESEEGRFCFPELGWEGGLVVPARADTQAAFRLTRAYRVRPVALKSDFRILYYACRNPSLNFVDDLLLGTEAITAAEAKTPGLHSGLSPELRIGRPGRQYVGAVLEAGLPEAPGTSRILVSAQAVEVTGLTDLVIDNGEPGYSDSGPGWQGWSGPSYGDSVRFCAAGTGANSAMWQVAGLLPGVYEVQLSWSPHPNRATNAPLQVVDGMERVAVLQLNQQRAPEGPVVNGHPFQALGRFAVRSGRLRVILTDQADGYVIADALRVVGPLVSNVP
jgi:ABC-type polysaccharide/polyol phosphate transport system ATPase subunit